MLQQVRRKVKAQHKEGIGKVKAQHKEGIGNRHRDPEKNRRAHTSTCVLMHIPNKVHFFLSLRFCRPLPSVSLAHKLRFH